MIEHEVYPGCESCIRLTRERDYSRDCNDALIRSLAAARAHVRRACERLSENWNNQFDGADRKSTDSFLVDIMVEVNKELEGKP